MRVWWLRLLAALYLLLAVSACKGAMTLAHSAGLGMGVRGGEATVSK